MKQNNQTVTWQDCKITSICRKFDGQHIEGSSIGNTFDNRYIDWQEEGSHIQKIIRQYNWEYRKKICSKCPIEKQQELNCIKIDNFKNGIQETYCSKLTKSRSKKFKKIILKYMDFHPSNSKFNILFNATSTNKKEND